MNEPCTLVIFGATGNLSRIKLLPALYQLERAARLATPDPHPGLRPARLVRCRLARGGPGHPDRAHRGGSGPIGRGAPGRTSGFRQRRSGGRLRLRAPGRTPGAPRTCRTNRIFYLAIAPAHYGVVAQHLAAQGLQSEAAGWSRLVVEKPFGYRPGECPDPRRAPAPPLPGGPDLPHRPLPGQEHGPEHPGLPLRQPAAGTPVEPQLHRPCADLPQRGARHRGAGRLLRRGRGHARHDPEPPVADADPGGHGAAALPGRRGPARREGQGPALHPPHPAGGGPCPRLPRPVPRRADRARTSCPGYLEEPGVGHNSTTETYAALKLYIDNWRWRGVPVLSAHRQAPGAHRVADRHPLQAPAPAALPLHRHRVPQAQLAAAQHPAQRVHAPGDPGQAAGSGAAHPDRAPGCQHLHHCRQIRSTPTRP